MYAAAHAADTPDAPAIVMAATGQTVTFAGYEAGANRVAHLSRELGLRRGDHVAIVMDNHPRMLEIEGAAERTGLYYTVVNSYLRPEELAYVVNDSRARVLAVSAATREAARAAAGDCPGVERRAAPPADGQALQVPGRPAVPGRGRPVTATAALADMRHQSAGRGLSHRAGCRR